MKMDFVTQISLGIDVLLKNELKRDWSWQLEVWSSNKVPKCKEKNFEPEMSRRSATQSLDVREEGRSSSARRSPSTRLSLECMLSKEILFPFFLLVFILFPSIIYSFESYILHVIIDFRDKLENTVNTKF